MTISLSFLGEEILNCEYGKPACECEKENETCRFNLEIDEIKTFTSYRKIFEDELTGVAMRGTKAVIYYFAENGTALPLNLDPPCSMLDNTNCTNPQFVDGKTYRLAIAVNGQIPGPTLIVHEGQQVEIHVKNNLTTEGISIHWHGMHQRGSPWMDGVGQVTQCPIGPQSSFLYQYKATPSGTFWYHSHSGGQKTDGLFGALIVRENSTKMMKIRNDLNNHGVHEEFEDLPGQHTLTLLDWQQEASLDLFVQAQGGVGFYPNKSYGEVPTPDDKKYSTTKGFEGASIGPVPYFSGLINGKGRHADVPYNKTRLSIFTVEHGKTYRFRLVGAQGLYAYRFSIDGHKLTVVGTDGYWLEPVKDVDFIIIHTGERYDFLLSANNTNGSINNYWMRAETLEIHYTSGSEPPYQSLGHVAEAILHYKQPGEEDDPDVNVTSTQYQEIKDNSPPIRCTNDAKCKAVNCPFKEFHESYNITCVNVQNLTLLEPTPPGELPNANPKDPEKCPNCTHFINFNFEGETETSSVNGRSFLLPSFPPQTQHAQFEENDITCNLTADCNPSTLDCSCVHVIGIAENETVQMVFSAIGKYDAPHPIHLHGHTFHVVHVGYPEYNSIDGAILQHAREIHCDDTSCTKENCDKGRCTRPSWAKGSKPDISIHNKTVRKDTVMVPAGGFVVINFISDNPGWWFLHCHIELHQLEGMALIVNESPGKLQPPEMPRCGDFEQKLNING